MGNFIKMGTTLSNANLTKLTADATIDNSTVMLIDFGRKTSVPNQTDLVNGDTVGNLVEGQAGGSVITGTKFLFSAAGKYITKQEGDISTRIQLPEVCKVKATDRSFQFSLWFTHIDKTDTTGNQALGGYASNSSNQMPFAFYWYDGQYNLGCAGSRAAFATPAAGTVHQLSVACDLDLGIRKFYHNNELIRTETNIGLSEMTQPAAGSLPWLFYLGGGFNSRGNIKMHRAWLDINGGGAKFDAKVAADYNTNYSRFAA